MEQASDDKAPSSPSLETSQASAAPHSFSSAPHAGIVAIFAGPPGAAEADLQRERIVQRYGLVHVSVRRLLSEDMPTSELGAKVKEYIDMKELVPNELMVRLLQDRLSKPDVTQRGCLLDGFPLTADHAKAMKGQIEVDHFIVIDAPDEALIDTSDGEEPARASLAAYRDTMAKVTPFFEDRVCHLNAKQDPEAMFNTICARLGPAPITTPTTRKQPVIIVTGPPATGKGIQRERLVKKFGFVPISASELLRKNVKRRTEEGIKAKEYIDKDEQVPSELMVRMLRDRMSKSDILMHGCLLEAFPLSSEHAKAMQGQIDVDFFFFIDAPDEELMERMCKPPEDMLSRLMQSDDGSEKKARKALKASRASLKAILPHFQEQMRRIDGNQHPDKVFKAISTVLGGPSVAPTKIKRGRSKADKSSPSEGGQSQYEGIAETLETISSSYISAGNLLLQTMQPGRQSGPKTREVRRSDENQRLLSGDDEA